jgi:hypothetical protein
MAKPKKKAEWYRFGRSGDTIDGRVINVNDIQQAADSYDVTFYTALIWPDHKRWFNLGKVVAVRAEKNDEGGMDLYGQVEANEYYKDMNKMGQRLFFSMELWPNFRKTEKTYLSGLAATDEPASVATSEVHLSRVDEGVAVGDAIEAVPLYFDTDESEKDEKTLLSLLSKLLFNHSHSDESDDSQEDDMNQEQYNALNTKLDAVIALSQTETDTPPETNTESQTTDAQVQALQTENDTLKTELTETKTKLSQVETAVTDLKKEFKAALEEQPGTNGGEHDGDGKDLSACI